MSDFAYTDSELQMDTQLILCIEECEPEGYPTSVDTRLFIGWDPKYKDYFVRGRRDDTTRSNCVPYAFHCETAKKLYDFIKITMGDSRVNYILYNFNNKTLMSLTDITYEFLEENMDKNYEVAGYDDSGMTRSKILRYLRVLKNTYNWEEK